MGKNSNQLFREKSLERIESPEKVNALIKVLNPRIWILLVAILVAIIGVLIWAFAGNINQTIDVNYRSYGYGGEVLYVTEDQISEIAYGLEISSDDTNGKVTGWDEEPYLAKEVMDEYLMHLNGLTPNSFVYEVRTNLMSYEGIHSAKIVVDKISPIKFITGN